MKAFKSKKGKTNCKKKNSNQSTNGIAITNGFQFNTKKIKAKIQFDIWDFGGQEIFYPTHQFFLTDKSIYFVVFRCDKILESRIEYWMKTIKCITNNTNSVKVFLVGTHADLCTKSQLESITQKLQNQFRKQHYIALQSPIFCISSHTGDGISALTQHLIETIDNDFFPIIPESWIRLYEYIQKLKENNPLIHSDGSSTGSLTGSGGPMNSSSPPSTPPLPAENDENNNYLSWSKFKELATLHCAVDELLLHGAAEFLSTTGTITYISDHLGGLDEFVVLKPQWLANIMSKVVTFVHSFIKDGILNQQDIIHIFKEYPPEIHQLLINYLKKFKIILFLKKRQCYLIPSLLPENIHSNQILSFWPEFPWEHPLSSFAPSSSSSPFQSPSHPSFSSLYFSSPDLSDPSSGDAGSPFDSHEGTKEMRNSTGNANLNQQSKDQSDQAIGDPIQDGGDQIIEFGRNYEFLFLPMGFIPQIIGRILLYDDIEGLLYWRNGMIIKLNNEIGYIQFYPETFQLFIRIRCQRKSQKQSKLIGLLVYIIDSSLSILYGIKDDLLVTKYIPCSHCLSTCKNKVNHSHPFLFKYQYLVNSLLRGHFAVPCEFDPLESILNYSHHTHPIPKSPTLSSSSSTNTTAGNSTPTRSRSLMENSPLSPTGNAPLSPPTSSPSRTASVFHDSPHDSHKISKLNAKFKFIKATIRKSDPPSNKENGDSTGNAPTSPSPHTSGGWQAGSFDHSNPGTPLQQQGDTGQSPGSVHLFDKEKKKQKKGKKLEKAEKETVMVKLEELAPDVLFSSVKMIEEKKITIIKQIGKGGFGTVYSGQLLLDKQTILVAIKELHIHSQQSSSSLQSSGMTSNEYNNSLVEIFNDFINEVSVMHQISHPNLVKLYGIQRSPALRMIIEFIPFGNLRNYLDTVTPQPLSATNQTSLTASQSISLTRSQLLITPSTPEKEKEKEKAFDWKLRLLFCFDIAKAMSYLDFHQFVHRDLRTENILVNSFSIDEPIRAKLADFGLSRQLIDQSNEAGHSIWQYNPPERFRVGEYDIYSDVYSFAICCWEIGSRRLPYAEYSDCEKYYKITNNGQKGLNMFNIKNAICDEFLRPSLDLIDEGYPPGFKEFLNCAWATEKCDRPSFKNIVDLFRGFIEYEFESTSTPLPPDLIDN